MRQGRFQKNDEAVPAMFLHISGQFGNKKEALGLLVDWEGLVTKTKDKTAMEEGDRIFGELINKGFLIAQYKPSDKDQDKNPIVDSCTRSRSMCLVPPTNNVSAGGPPNQPANPATVTEAGAGPDASRLLTLFNVNEQYLNIPHDWFSKANKIVVLQLGRWKDSAKHHNEVENEDHKEKGSLAGLGDVAGLKKLRKLSIYIPSDAYIEGAELSKLKEVSALRILSITWGGGRGGGGRVQAETEPSGKPTTIDRKKSFASKKDRHQVQRIDIKTMVLILSSKVRETGSLVHPL
ncbi:hypothetical protein CK203_033807 [Vitis vinifera]|uniref:Uncharacterized protein n=1 Tax=Vitis vinifera TaxID=29760 RepID=A0A438IQD2_VITVI|nr:hypothetical protein CK203_033807 [Vitis vinifera]